MPSCPANSSYIVVPVYSQGSLTVGAVMTPSLPDLLSGMFTSMYTLALQGYTVASPTTPSETLGPGGLGQWNTCSRLFYIFHCVLSFCFNQFNSVAQTFIEKLDFQLRPWRNYKCFLQLPGVASLQACNIHSVRQREEHVDDVIQRQSCCFFVTLIANDHKDSNHDNWQLTL
jgi:hypothetical protein